MQLSSIEFIFYFLPAFMLVWFVTPRRCGHAVLSIGSFIFYWFASKGSILAMAVLAAVAVETYFGGILIERHRARGLLALFVSLPSAGLIFMKLWAGGTLLPVGMSFYVFSSIAYVTDVYRKKLRAHRGFIHFLSGFSMFPKLLSGPIAEPARLARDIRFPHRRGVTFHLGVQQFIIGLGLKVVLADRLGGIWGQAMSVGMESVSGPYMWLAIISWSMRLYFDFAGYSLMAVGLGHMVGFHLPMNFIEPFSSGTVSEFYRRWHATLGRWFREYIYIPLGGSRRGIGRTILNLMIVWALTGFWHGVGVGYLLWAGITCLFIIMERLWLRKLLDKTRVLCHVYVVLAILLSWVPFASAGTGEALVIYGRLFGAGGSFTWAGDFLPWFRDYLPYLVAGVVFVTPLPGRLWRRIWRKGWADVLLFMLFWVCVYFIATSGIDPFMYSVF